MTKTKRGAKKRVWTCVKSQDQIWSAWFRRNVPQFWLEGDVAGEVSGGR